MSKKIEIVKAFRYDGNLFDTRLDVDKYIKGQVEHRKMLKELSNQKKLDNPMTFTIKNGYFDFLVFNSDTICGEPDKRICYKRTSFLSALNSVLKRQDVVRLDYESEILDRNKHSTGIFIDLNKMPANHPVHKYT